MRLPSSLMRAIAVAAFSLGLLCVATTPARATTIQPQVFTWSGTCIDCTGTATGTLTMVGTYVPGTPINISNFLSFHYSGTNLQPAFTISFNDPGIWLFGSVPTTLPGPGSVDIYNGLHEFETGTFTGSTVGSWCVSSSAPFGTSACNPADFGVASTFAAVPEPASLLLLSSGLLALRRVRRRSENV